MKAGMVAVIFLVALFPALGLDLGWTLALSGGGGVALPSGGYLDFMGQELADAEGHTVFIMGPAGSIGASASLWILPWLAASLDMDLSLSVPLYQGQNAAWILWCPQLGFRMGADAGFSIPGAGRLSFGPRIGMALMPLGLWEGSSFSGLSVLERESASGTDAALSTAFRLNFDHEGRRNAVSGLRIFLEAGYTITTLLDLLAWGGEYKELKLALGAGYSWRGLSSPKPGQSGKRPQADGDAPLEEIEAGDQIEPEAGGGE